MAAYQIPALQTFTFKSEEWENWLRRFERFRQATGLSSKSEETQINTLIYSMGDKAEDILRSFTLSDEDAKKYSVVIEKFNRHFVKRRNIIYDRAKFNSRTQQEGEPVEDFIHSVHSLAQHCSYGDLNDQMIRDRIVVGIRDSSLSQKLQMEADLTLEKATKMVRESEAIKKQQKTIREKLEDAAELDAIRKGRGKSWHHKSRQNQRPQQIPPTKPSVCTRCGQSAHGRLQCPAKDQICHRCSKVGHFKKMCRTKGIVREVKTDQEEFLGAIHVDTADTDHKEKSWTTTLELNERTLTFKIDTGADVTVISQSDYNAEKDGPLSPPSKQLTGPSHEALDVCGQFTGQLQRNAMQTMQDVYVVKGLHKPLLGRPAIEALNIIAFVNGIQLQEVIKRFPQLFTGLGRLKDSYKIKLKEGAIPFALSVPRRVAIPLLPRVKEELERMTKLGVISKVTEPTEWCAGMVVVPKPGGKVRICVDLTKLNTNVCRERHILPSVENTLAQLAGAKHFTKLDANSGFWQIEMEPDSAKFTTFITPFGRYQFNRLPFGITSAPEHFQRRMNEILGDIEGAVCLIDDILIYGKTQSEHDQRLLSVLNRINKAGLTLNKEKCVFNTTSINFLGQQIDNSGVKADPEKIRAVKELPPPKNVSELRRFLGMVNQLSKFLPCVAEETKPLRDLLSKKNQWHWDSLQDQAFAKLKLLLGSSEVLSLYDPSLHTVVSADASAYGLGGVLRQRQANGNLRPVAYTSRALTETEQRYAQIEKEALAVTWACERFQDYLTGLLFHIETDHKPLVPLLSTKNLDEMPLRVQRFRMRLMRYQYTISHVAGKDLCTADALSRAPSTEVDKHSYQFQEEIASYVNLIIDHLPATETKMQEIKEKQKEDPVCQKLVSYCQTGWPDKSKLQGPCKAYAAVMHELSVIQGLLLRGHRIVIPSEMQGDIIEKLHAGHQGIAKCRRPAQQSVWWPGLGKTLNERISTCPTCCQHRSVQVEPLIPTEMPNRPWERVATDLFEWQRAQYLLVVDYYSKYIEVAKLDSISSLNVIKHLKSIFARHGIPEVVVSDNGPQYSSEQFTEFSNQYGFIHITSSPKYPQSNGAAERAVRTIKQMLTKNQSKGEDINMAMLVYRSTPLENGSSPAELLMNRKLRTTVPMISQQLKPKVPNQSKLRKKENENRKNQKRYYDKRHRARRLSTLKPGEAVWVPAMKKTAKVLQKRGIRSYLIRTTDGLVYRRNRKHLNWIPKSHHHEINNNDTADPKNIPPVEPAIAIFPEHNCANHTQADNNLLYQTRSGRNVRPPLRYGQT